MKRLLSILFIFHLSFLIINAQDKPYSQEARDLIRQGNREYRASHYEKAETYYRKSIAKLPTFEAYYNLGNTLVMQQKDSTAFECYSKADSLHTPDPLRRARCFHNMGNIWYAQGLAAANAQDGDPASAFQNAVNLFSSSLRCNPNDDETRYNLAMAQYMLKKYQKNGGGSGGSDDKNKDKNEQDKKKEEQQKQQQQQQQQQEQKKNEMSDQAAQQLLNSAQQDEKDVQRKVNNQNRQRRSLEKDW